jgi:hypothetical protein
MIRIFPVSPAMYRIPMVTSAPGIVDCAADLSKLFIVSMLARDSRKVSHVVFVTPPTLMVMGDWIVMRWRRLPALTGTRS